MTEDDLALRPERTESLHPGRLRRGRDIRDPAGEASRQPERRFRRNPARLRCGAGKLISISGPPDPAFAKDLGSPWILRPATRVLSYRARREAKRRQVRYSFLFMRANGDQLREIGSLIDSGIIRPVLDRVFPFESTKEAMAYVESGRAKGEVVVKVV